MGRGILCSEGAGSTEPYLLPRMDSEQSQAGGFHRFSYEAFIGLVQTFSVLCSQYPNALPLKCMGVCFEDL